MSRHLTEGKIQMLKNQTTLDFGDAKIFESRSIALAQYKILGKLTRNAVKILVSSIKEDDVEFREQEIPITQLAGGWQEAGGDTYRAGKEEIEIMAGDGLAIDIIKGEKAVFFNFFAGKIEYDHKKSTIKCALNPLLRPFYLKLKDTFSVLALAEYLRLSRPFYKDLYEWLIGHQGATDFEFEIGVEKFCEHFGCVSYLRHRDDLVKRIYKAHLHITKLTDLRFEFIPHYRPTVGERNGELQKLRFKVKTGEYYKYAAARKKEREERELLAKAAQEIEAYKKAGLTEAQIEMIKRTIAEERAKTEE